MHFGGLCFSKYKGGYMIRYDFKTFINISGIDKYKVICNKIKKKFDECNEGEIFTDVSKCIPSNVIEKIKKVSKYIRANADIFLVIGVGGSYHGSRALVDMFTDNYKKDIEIIYTGYSLNSSNLSSILDYIKDKRIIVNVISKSGNTMEINLVFSKVLELMKNKYKEKELRKRIIITTNKNSGKLLSIAKKNNYMKFYIPDISGRYSIMTPVGLLPICVAGVDIDSLIKGYKDGIKNIDKCFMYAVIRDILYKQGKKIEAFTVYDEKLLSFNDFLKQLFAETQGKKGKGLLPISVFNTRDMHSLGQYFAEGEQIYFSTVINIVNNKDVKLKDKSLNKINNIAMLSIAKSYISPSIIINIDKINEENIGELLYFFMVAAAIGGYLIGVNPYNQPGVNNYKKVIKESLNGKYKEKFI